MRIVSAILWGIVGVVVGAIEGGTFGWALGYVSVAIGTQIGAALGLLTGLIYGFLARKAGPNSLGSSRRRVSFERCAWCQGTGWEDKKKQRRCGTCEGEGRVVVSVPPQKCVTCKGKGRSFLKRKCQVCAGAGWEPYSLLSPAVARQIKPATSRRWLFPRSR